MRQILPILLIFALALAGAYALWLGQVREKKLRLRVQKLYASQLFEDITPMLRWLRRHSPESLSVDKTGLSVRMVNADTESAFLMRPNGYRYLTPEQQEAMRVVLEECLPNLRDANRYCLTRRRVRLLNGDVEYAYHYTITNHFKSSLMRAAYYNGEVEMYR